MASLVFDIETSALDLDRFDQTQQAYLLRDADRLENEEARQARRTEIQQWMSLWPLTAQVLCIAMVNAETHRGKVLYISDDFEDSPSSPADPGANPEVEYSPCVDESELLTGFWDVARHYEQVVTFNGRGFDVPFLYLRSALLNVDISRKDWLGYRFANEPHCDLADQLTFYNVGGRDGASRRFNLDFYCKAFGISSPKAEGVSGMDVPRLQKEGGFRDIADYCLRDVVATAQLFQIWKDRLAGIK